VKLRVRADSIRLRLGQSEVQRLADEGRVEERTHFTPGAPALVYALRTDASSDTGSISAAFDGGALVVTVPRAVALRWASTEQVGLEASQPAGNGETLRILIEKDFECVDAPTDESQADAFPNPRTKC
jgi:hypothetical protein